MRDNEAGADFADVWCAIPKVVFSRTLGTVLLLATIGLSTCQGGFNASLPGATISTPLLESAHG